MKLFNTLLKRPKPACANRRSEESALRTRQAFLAILMLAIFAVIPVWLAGCGGGGTTNVITVTVFPSAQVALAGQTYNFTATVSGTTTLTVTTWNCTYSYTPAATQSNPSPKAVTGTCTSGGTISGVTGKIGTWTISTANNSNVLSYAAPALADFPNPAPTLTFQPIPDAKKDIKCSSGSTCEAAVSLDSGIRVSVTPSTATVPVGLTPAQTATFLPSFLNANPSGQQFKLVQPNTASSTTADQTATPQTPDTCDPTCGTIDNATGIYTAPGTLPTDTKPTGSKSTSATTVDVVVWNSADPNHFALATVTLVDATTNPVTFSGLYPPSIQAGGLLQDVFLNAKNLLNTTEIDFVSPTSLANFGSAQKTRLDINTQIFTIPISPAYCTASASGVTPVITCDASIMTRIRLNATQLASAEPDPSQPAWILIPNLPGAATASGDCQLLTAAGVAPSQIACPLHIVNSSPTVIAATPDSIAQPTGSGEFEIAADGGYFGSGGGLVNVTLNGNAVNKPGTNSSGQAITNGARRVVFAQDNSLLPPPGLYEASVTSSASQGAAPMFLSATTNIAIQPNFSFVNTLYNPSPVPSYPTTPPTCGAQNYPVFLPPCVSLGSGNFAPSSIAVNSVKGYAIIAEQASSTLQLVDLSGSVPALLGAPFSIAPGSQPTSVVIDDQVQLSGGADLAIVVSSGDGKLYLYSVTKSGFTFLNSIAVDLTTLLGAATATGLGTPYSFGVDPITHLGVVAYTGNLVGTNIAFTVDADPNTDGTHVPPFGLTCYQNLSGKPPCVIAPVSVLTGPTPQVVVEPNVPIAYVTPGGANGPISVVNLLAKGTSVSILPAASTSTASGAFCSATVTTIKTVTPHGINAALGGTVIIAGITAKNGTKFNGTFLVSVVDPYTFNYSQPDCPAGGDQETNDAQHEGTVQYGSPYYSFSSSSNVAAAAINPVTRTVAFADFFASSAQINFIGTLDQTLTSLSLSAGSCNGCTPNPAGGPEVNFRSLAFDPFTNVVLAYNPGPNIGANFPENAVSLINPGGPTAGGGNSASYRIIQAIETGQIGQGSYTPSGASSAVTVNGPMTYDPKSRFVLVANAGSNTLSYLNLDPLNAFQNLHIQALQLGNTPCTNASTCYAVPIAQPTLGSLTTATTCAPGDPSQPCMPQAVQVGKDAHIRLFGQGFSAGVSVRLDGRTAIIPPGQTTPVPITTTPVSDSEVDATIPAAVLFAPHVYAVDVQTSASATSNAVDLYVVGITNVPSTVCQPTAAFPQGPEAVAIDESRRIALITNYACNNVSIINLDFTGQLYPGVAYGGFLGTAIAVGKNPIGVDVIPRMGLAVVGNSGESPTGTASIINISNPLSPQIVQWSSTSGSTTTTSNAGAVGISPVGVAIDQDRALALVANSGSNTLSVIDLTVFLPTDPASGGGHTQGTPTVTTVGLSGPPTAVAVDPNDAIAVVTNLQNSGTTAVSGGLDVVSLASNPPARNSSASISSLTANPTGIVFDPGDPNVSPIVTGLFYATSTLQNAVYSFNPSTSGVQTIRVGINPYSVGFNYQTGTLISINSTSNTSSVIDSQNFKTRETLGISSQSQLAVAVDKPTNTAVIVDQNNNRVVFLALPR